MLSRVLPPSVYNASLFALEGRGMTKFVEEVGGIDYVGLGGVCRLEVNKCVSEKNVVREHVNYRKAVKRLSYKPLCGRVYLASTGYRERIDLENPSENGVVEYVNRFHPVKCRSIFCPSCFSERVRKNNDRVDFFFDYLASSGIDRVSLITLTPPSHQGWDASLILKVEKAWKRLLNIVITDRLINKIKPLLREEARLHYESLKKQWSRDVALEHVRSLYRWSIRFLEANRGKKVSKVFGQALAVFQIVVKKEDGVKSVHPHIHIVSVKAVPQYVLVVLWSLCGGGKIVNSKEIRGLQNIRQYLRGYLRGRYDDEGDIYDGFLDIRCELTVEEMVELETYLWGFHFARVIGLRYRRRERPEIIRGWRYRVIHFDYRNPVLVVGYGEGVRIFRYDGLYWAGFISSIGWINPSPELSRRIEENVVKGRGSFDSHLQELLSLCELSYTF